MTGKKIYLAIQTVLCVLIVVMLSVGAVRIYQEGTVRKEQHPLESIYTQQAVADAFAGVAPILFAAVGMAVAGLLLGAGGEKEKAPKDPVTERDLITARVKTPDGAMKQETARQRVFRIAGWAGFGLCMIPVAVYLGNAAHFPSEDPEAMIAGVAAGTFPWIAAGMACLVIFGLLENRSVRRQTEAARRVLQEEKAAAAGKKEQAAASSASEGSGASGTAGEASPGPQEVRSASDSPQGAGNGKTKVLQAAVLAAAAVFLVLGILNGGLQDVLIKAINICTECVGLG